MSSVVIQNPWRRAARFRRTLFLPLILVPSILATVSMAKIMPSKGIAGLEILILVSYGVLFAWISVGFWISFFGFVTSLRGRDCFSIVGKAPDIPAEIPPDVRCAILIPICNEDPGRVYAGAGATYRSVAETGRLDRFDLFILSDSTEPEKWVEEEAGWFRLCETLEGFNRIFYRRRRSNIKRKSGNIADFCRRWGRNYRYMIVLDADSVMAGNTIVHMIDVMEKNPQIGILQTAPKIVNQHTLLGRLQQFANHAYGPIWSAGLRFCQLGDAQFWGHNAVIRIAPFMAHCGLPRLSGRPPLGGEILSHDFVEAALMRRAGWEVWMADELDGSYEESPPNLVSELGRDRRWCQGNMQHLRLLFAKGLFPAHRLLFLGGAMSYISGLLWFLFLSANTVVAVFQGIWRPDYFPAHPSLFPDWPIWNKNLAIGLIISVGVVLFLPKILGVALVIIRGKADAFGGAARLLAGMVIESVVSSLLAPIRMIFHSRFVFMTLFGLEAGWLSQPREEEKTHWRDAFRFHGKDVFLGFVWGAGVFLLSPPFFWWLLPILVALVLSVPLSVLTSKASVGRMIREHGLLVVPEELMPPREFGVMKALLPVVSDPRLRGNGAFAQAVVDPFLHALHLFILGGRKASLSRAIAARRARLRKKALEMGPEELDSQERKALLKDGESLAILHREIWESESSETAGRWGIGKNQGIAGQGGFLHTIRAEALFGPSSTPSK